MQGLSGIDRDMLFCIRGAGKKKLCGALGEGNPEAAAIVPGDMYVADGAQDIPEPVAVQFFHSRPRRDLLCQWVAQALADQVEEAGFRQMAVEPPCFGVTQADLDAPEDEQGAFDVEPLVRTQLIGAIVRGQGIPQFLVPVREGLCCAFAGMGKGQKLHETVPSEAMGNLVPAASTVATPESESKIILW